LTFQVGRVRGAQLAALPRHPLVLLAPAPIGTHRALFRTRPFPAPSGADEPAHLVPPLKFVTAPDDAATWSHARGLSKENSE